MSSGHPFAGRRTRILGVEDVKSLVSIEDAITVQRQAFIAQAEGKATAAPNSWLRLPEQERRRGWLKVLAGHESSSGSLGVKVLARFADNPPGSNLGSLVLLFDDTNGFPLAVMDGVVITALRTGAGAGLATEVLAAPDAAVVGVVGTGVVAWYSLLAVVVTRPSVRQVCVYSRSESRRQKFANRAREELGLSAAPVTSVDHAVRDAQILITGTNAPTPVIEAEHLCPGQHVNAMGIRSEISPEALAKAWVVPDGVEEASNDGKFSVALRAGTVTRQDLGPEIGRVLADGTIGHDPERISLFDSSGVAVQDVTMARHLWEQAEKQGMGVEVDLGLESGPL